MTTHGFSGIKRWVFGSTTEKILQAASKPILVIPARRAENTLERNPSDEKGTE